MKGKRALSIALLVASIMAITGTSATAYWDGDREVNYYSYDLSLEDETNIYAERLGNSMERLYGDRNWVISVNSVSSTSYPICYDLVRGNCDDAYSNPAYQKGTGNTGASYRSTKSVGWTLWLNAYLDYRELSRKGKTSSGQWSTDAPY